MKRKLTPRQLAFLAYKRKLSKDRLWLWKHKRAKMEIAQAKATAESIKVREDVNTIIIDTVREWPAILTPAQLDELMLMFPYQRKGKKRRMRRNSLVRRLRVLGVIAYVPSDNTWRNLCHLPAALASEDSPDKDEPQPQGDSERPDGPNQGGQVV